MNNTKSGGAIAIASSCSENFSQSFSIPNNWPLPKFAIGDRVEYVDMHCLMTCTIRGLEYMPDELPNYAKYGKSGGWYYYLLPDFTPTIKRFILDDAFIQPVDESELTSI